MGYEFDFFQVGEASKPGDATCFRFGDLFSPNHKEKQFVGVIDAGTRDTGVKMAEHIKEFYKTETIDVAFATHPHDDHIQGLFSLIENMSVKNLVMHLPWEYNQELHEILDDGRRTHESVRTLLQRSLYSLNSLHETAKANGVTVHDFLDDSVQAILPSEITILGPSYDYYMELLPAFVEDTQARVTTSDSLFGRVRDFFDFLFEALEDPAERDVSAMNNSSAIILISVEENRFLFTGDAGVPALDLAIDYAEQNNICIYQPNYFHIPHHGSARNLGPTILDRLCGPKLGIFEAEGECLRQALVSLAKEENDKHPSKKVLNALRRRGYKSPKISDTICFRKDAPDRGWGAVEYHPFYENEE